MNPGSLIAEQLFSVMNSKGWTQNDLAKLSGVDQSQVSRILRGRFVRVSKNVRKLCEYAKISCNYTPSLMPLPDAVGDAVRGLLDGTKEREKAVINLLKAEARLLRGEKNN